MTREADVVRNGFLRSQCRGWPTHLLSTDDVPIWRSSPSTNGDADESEPSGTVCPKDVLTCLDGSFVSREIDDGCNFASCPDRAHPDAGHLFPVWGSDGNIVCVDDTSPPSWALGAYLKEIKSDCCKAYSILQRSECVFHMPTHHSPIPCIVIKATF